MKVHVQFTALAVAAFLAMATFAAFAAPEPTAPADEDPLRTMQAQSGTVVWDETDAQVSFAEDLFPGNQKNLYEPHISIAPGDPTKMVAFAIDLSAQNANPDLYSTIRAFKSTDGGATWTDQGPMPYDADGTVYGAGDPVTLYGPDGTLYFSSLADAPDASEGGIWVHRSTDDGTTWAPPVLAVDEDPNGDGTCPSTDKEWFAIDPDSGTLYLTYTEFLAQCEAPIDDPMGAGSLLGLANISVRFTKSTDGGLTWTELTTIWDAYALGAQPKVTPAGTLLVAFWSTTADPVGSCPFATSAVVLKAGGLPFSALVLARSADGGETWTFEQRPVCVPDAAFGLKPAFMPGGNFLPSLSVDPTTGDAHVGFPEYLPEEHRFTVRMVSSTDDGATWSPASTVVPGPLDARMPALFAHADALRVAYVATSDEDETGYLAYTESHDGGASWSPPTALSTALWDLAPNPDLGDYLGVDVVDDRIVVTWTDARNGSPTEIWARTGTIPMGET